MTSADIAAANREALSVTETMLINLDTREVASESEWHSIFESMTKEEREENWGVQKFEDADLVEAKWDPIASYWIERALLERS